MIPRAAARPEAKQFWAWHVKLDGLVLPQPHPSIRASETIIAACVGGGKHLGFRGLNRAEIPGPFWGVGTVRGCVGGIVNAPFLRLLALF